MNDGYVHVEVIVSPSGIGQKTGSFTPKHSWHDLDLCDPDLEKRVIRMASEMIANALGAARRHASMPTHLGDIAKEE